MSLKERIAEKSAALVQRETITLPKCGEVVVVRGLMQGELSRVNAAPEAQRGTVVICLATEDPANPGKPLWNVNDLHDQEAVGGLHVDDAALIINTHNRLSGLDASEAALLKNSVRTENGLTSSPPVTGFPPASSEAGLAA
jgi:hypothetical protein